MARPDTGPIQGSLFEEDYLLRTLGSIATIADVGLTELVANAWDAGASKVEITIPDQHGDVLIVEDDGAGMTPDQFKRRWMTLGYNRTKHQGILAEFPPKRENWRRRAYGRNGVGRHSLLCFADHYAVRTCRDDVCSEFLVATASGKNPFVLVSQKSVSGKGHGTRLTTEVTRNLPDPERIREVLAGRFVSDPQFKIYVNGRSVPLTEHSGLISRQGLTITQDLSVEILFIELDDTSKRVFQHGVAFWVSGRLVGHPSWALGDRVLLDGRTRLAKRHTVVVRGDDLFDLVLPDWTAFRPGKRRDLLFGRVGDYVLERINELAQDQVEQTKADVFRRHRGEIEKLKPLGRIEVEDLVSYITSKHPTISQDYLSIALEAAVQVQKFRSGAELLERLAKLSEEDVEGLNRLLSDWTVRDALTVLDEIDKRVAVIEALDKLSADPKVDELHTLHPLVTQARWLFGPEFDSPEYASNMTLVNAVKKVFQKRLTPEAFLNAKKRPDLVILKDATLSVTGTEQFLPDGELTRLQSVLIIEVKRGESTISRDQMHQASDYIQDLHSSGAIEGRPFFYAYVVGHKRDIKTESIQKIGDPPLGRVEACTYNQLARTATRRLFSLRERLRERYFEDDGQSLLQRVLREPYQLTFNDNEVKGA